MHKLLLTGIFLFAVLQLVAQVTIVSSSVSPYNVTPSSLSQFTVMNNAAAGQVYAEIKLTNSANQVLVSIRSEVVELNTGLTVFGPHNLMLQSVVYGSSQQARFIQSQHRLSSGNYNHCIVLIPVAGLEEGDEYCNQINAEEDGFLYLVNPSDQDTIETKNPVLLWMHSEPFNLLAEGEFFRMRVVSLREGQSAGDGVNANSPIYLKNYLSRHEQLYPFDAKALEPGGRYGWQVQKVANGAVINQTEAWEFVLAETTTPEDHMYVALKRKPDGSSYRVQNERIYFRFEEKYRASKLNCRIFNDRGEPVSVSVRNTKQNWEPVKVGGDNRFELDLQPYDLKRGFYLLEVSNEKEDVYVLKFRVE